MRNKSFLSLILANYAFNLAYFSQGNMVFDKYRINDGLNENNIKVIVQDTTGFIWIGTNGNGISKFDGYRLIKVLFL